jgi:hypothetical protein
MKDGAKLMGTNNILVAFGLTLFAGLSTGIGGLIAFIYRKSYWDFPLV